MYTNGKIDKYIIDVKNSKIPLQLYQEKKLIRVFQYRDPFKKEKREKKR